MLAVVGDIIQDTVIWLGEPLQEGSDTAGEVYVSRGGSAANVAAAAADTGAPTRFIGCVGEDLLGEILGRELEAAGVDTRLQVRGSTGVIVVLIDKTGERHMIPSRGASLLLQGVDEAWLDGVDVLHMTAYSLEAGATAVEVPLLAERVHARGGRVTLDASSSAILVKYGLDRFRETLQAIAPDVLFANEQEWDTLGLAWDGERVTGAPAATVVVRKAGADPTTVYVTGREPLVVPVPPVAEVRDTTGAGDAFAGAFLSRYLAFAAGSGAGPGDGVGAGSGVGRGDGVGAGGVAGPDAWREACEAGHALSARVLGTPGATLR